MRNEHCLFYTKITICFWKKYLQMLLSEQSLNDNFTNMPLLLVHYILNKVWKDYMVDQPF